VRRQADVGRVAEEEPENNHETNEVGENLKERPRRLETGLKRLRFWIDSRAVPVFCCAYFLLWGAWLIPYPGVQNDEALFGQVLYKPISGQYFINIFGAHIPIMLMTYLGCLKSWMYKAVFKLWPPSVLSIRVPVLVIGAITIWLFWLFARQTVGNRAAAVSTILLATDGTFLVTTCFDWGPVALQHFLMIAGVLALISFYQTGREKMLALGFFLFGLGLWDKALFSWILGGLSIATLVVFPAELRRQFNWRRLTIAGLSLTMGAFPLLCYNVQQDGITFRGNAKFSREDFGQKLLALRTAADGSAFFGYMVPATDMKELRNADTMMRRASVTLSKTTGNPRTNFTIYAFVLAFLMLPLLWEGPSRKPMLFSLVVMLVIWLQMAITKGAGTGVHHVVLMWPWPMFFIGAGFAESSLRLRRVGSSVLAGILLILAARNCLVSNKFLSELIQDGPATVWTDAVFSLADYLRSYPSADIYTVDWGTSNSLRLLDRGTLRLEEATFAILKDPPNALDRSFLRQMITNSNALLIAHTAPFEAFKGINDRLSAIATGLGYQQKLIAVIYDYEGRPVFQLVKYQDDRMYQVTHQVKK
jgi:4-amino-4-deoxy-L-arabinose transferase-like glycosyltransferase